MVRPNFERAQYYVRKRMERELPSNLYYHSVDHTFRDVLPAAERFAALEGVIGEPLLLLRTAACYHDIGFVEQYDNHETSSVRIATQALPRFGYGSEQIDIICRIIMATRLPQSPHTLLENIMADADLDMLGREDFLTGSFALRAELGAFGTPSTDAEWYRRQIDFFRSHRYFTSAAQNLREAQKQQNIRALVKLLAACPDGNCTLS